MSTTAGGGLFGREGELAAIQRALAEARRGSGALVLLSGEAGIGKTSLADEASRSAHAGGWRVAWGRSWEGEGTPAYWPWLQVLRALQRASPSLFDEAVATSPELSSLLSPERAGAPPPDPAQARFRLFDTVWRLLRAAAEERPLLVVLDDLHAADVASQLLARFVARHLRGSPILLIATSRDVGLDSSRPAAEVLANVAREAIHVPLGRLLREDLGRWIDSLAPRFAPRADAVFEISEGNPLFVHELLAAAHKRPDSAWTAAQLPLGIREAVRAHLRSVSDAALGVLESASVIGRDFSWITLGLLVPHDTATALNDAVAAGILTDIGDGKLRFSHILLRDELYARMGPRRADLHRALAAHLKDDAAVAAQHGLLGARPEDAADTARLVMKTMTEANQHLAFEDAADLGRRALAIVGEHLSAADQGALWLSVAEAETLAGRDTLSACVRVADLAESIDDPELLARAALVAATELTMNRRDGITAFLRRALASQPERDSIHRAQVMARLAAALVPPLPHEGPEFAELSRESVAMARRIGDEQTLFTALQLSMIAFPESFEPEERARVTTESVALARRLGQTSRVVPLLSSLVACRLELGDPDGAAREADAAEELLARFPQPHYQWRGPLVRSMLAMLAGRFAEADAEGRAGLKISLEHDVHEGVTMFCLQRMANHYVRGDGDGYEEFAALAAKVLAPNPLQPLFSAMPDALLGRTDGVREALARARMRDPATIPGVFALALAGVHAGVNEHAAFFYDALVARHASDTLVFGPGSLLALGPTKLLLGRLAAIIGQADVALRHYEEASTVARRIRSLPYVAQTEVAIAELLASRNVIQARDHAEIAGALAADLGMRAVGERAEAVLSRAARRTFVVAPPQRSRSISMEREGETWLLASGSRKISLRDTLGLVYLNALVREPHREVHVLELVGSDDGGDAGPVLDARAKRAYRERAESLRDELEAATQNADLGRAERAREELDALSEELARAVGLGGRDRRAGSAAERARVNVQRRMRDAIRRVGGEDAGLGRHLEMSVKTGLFCAYLPTWPD